MTPEIIDRIEKQMGQAFVEGLPERPKVALVRDEKDPTTAASVQSRIEELHTQLTSIVESATEIASRMAGPQQAKQASKDVLTNLSEGTVFQRQINALDATAATVDTLARQLERIVRSLG